MEIHPIANHATVPDLGEENDDHPQYALLDGRSGGQELNGGTDSGDDLTLKSTSNATKGTIKADGEIVRMKRLLAGGVTE